MLPTQLRPHGLLLPRKFRKSSKMNLKRLKLIKCRRQLGGKKQVLLKRQE